jgi:hypothetical protein
MIYVARTLFQSLELKGCNQNRQKRQRRAHEGLKLRGIPLSDKCGMEM